MAFTGTKRRMKSRDKEYRRKNKTRNKFNLEEI